MWAHFSGMPKLLKFLTAHAACCFVFLAFSVIPIDSYAIHGRHVTYAEWWGSGAGVLASLLGIVGPFAAWALAVKRPYARALYLVFLVLAFVVPCPFFGMLAYVIPGFLVVGVGAFYMFKWQSVQDYLAPNHSFEADGSAAAQLQR